MKKAPIMTYIIYLYDNDFPQPHENSLRVFHIRGRENANKFMRKYWDRTRYDIVEDDEYLADNDMKDICTKSILDTINTKGYVENTPKGLISVGFQVNDAKNHRRQIIAELIENDITLKACKMKDINNRRSIGKYFFTKEFELIEDVHLGKKIFISLDF